MFKRPLQKNIQQNKDVFDPKFKLKKHLNSVNYTSVISEERYYTFKPLRMNIKTVNTFGPFSECACSDGLFNRHKNQRRQQSENKIVKNAAHFDKNKEHVYISLGAGRLLQDYMICGKLLLAGYSLIIRLIEPLSLGDLLQKFIKQLERFAILGGSHFTVDAYYSVFQYQQKCPDEKIDIAVAIDFDLALNARGFREIICLHQCLSLKGFFYIAFNEYDYILKSKKATHSQYHGYDFFGWRPWFDSDEYTVLMKVPEINKKLMSMAEFIRVITGLPSCVINATLHYADIIPSADDVKMSLSKS